MMYRLGNWLPFNADTKLKLYLDFAWIFSRLAHEQTFRSSIKIPYNPNNDFLLNQIHKDASVLDIGCGTGHVIKRLLNKTSNIIGVDYDKNSIDIAKREISQTVSFICDDIFKYLKICENKKFDVIVLSHVLEHIDKPDLFLNKLNSIGKFFYIETPDFESNHLNLFRKYLDTDLVYSDADHVSEFDRNELSHIINESGLNILHTEFSFGVMKFWCSK